MGPVSNLDKQRFPVLDGWRGISILLVLAGHTLPIGPKRWELNETFAVSGMPLFFVLSGFLIARFLIERPNPTAFLIRRLCRIVPLAWLVSVVVLVASSATTTQIFNHIAFVANLPPIQLLPQTGHLWSLCVEMQFYLLAAALVVCLGKRGLFFMPLIGIGITAYRIYEGVPLSIVTYLRADEIFAGVCLALLHHEYGHKTIKFNSYFLFITVLTALLFSCHPQLPNVNYARPYLAAALIGISLFANLPFVVSQLQTKLLRYVAEISFALYVIHTPLLFTWLSSGETLTKYLKRPLYYGVLWLLAHLSTRYFESYWISKGRQWSLRMN